jgi:hypothetical protein
MPERSIPEGLPRRAVAAVMVALLVGAMLAPNVALAVVGPGQSCPDTTPAPGSSAAACDESKGPGAQSGGGSLDTSGLLPIIAAAVGGAVLALGAAFLVLRRRATAPAGPVDPGEWWTCPNCGRNNVVGSPRCYACGQWQA